jgi:hypothetical protein
MTYLSEVWCEGDPLRDFTAAHLGYGKGKTVEEVCKDLANNSSYFEEHYDPDYLTYKGCKLYTNEIEARESCG